MVKTSESAIKIVSYNKRKWLSRLTKTVTEVGETYEDYVLVTHAPPGRQQTPNPACFTDGTWKPRIAPLLGTAGCKACYGDASLGCRKKRMSGCNGPNTGLKVTRHESEQTSDWSNLAREYAEFYDEGKQMTTAAKPGIGAPSTVANWDGINWRPIGTTKGTPI